MPINTDLVEETAPGIRVLKDTVEYPWQVGCTGTAVGIVVGYWDRHGFSNLIEGDSSTYSDGVRRAIASEGHYADYYNPDGYETIIPDASEGSGPVHADDSIADFLHSSRSDLGLGDGWTYYGYEGIGLHGYASHRGYDDFKTTHENWGAFSFGDIAAEIDAGRPVILSVDSNADGRNDHNVVVFGYNELTNELLIHDGWASTDEPRWIDFARNSSGQPFGITAATFVVPPDDTTAQAGRDNIFSLVADGYGSAASWGGIVDDAGDIVDFQREAADSGFSQSRTLGIATADGHTIYQLYDDGSGSAALYKGLAYGDGEFRFLKLSSDSFLSRNTIEFATADGETFYQLFDDNSGSAALYEVTLGFDGTFDYTLLNANSGLGDDTIGFSTLDGNVFTQLVDDGFGTAAIYEAILNADGTFSRTLIDADSGLSRLTIGLAEWETRDVPAEGEVRDLVGTVQFLTGTGDTDVFILDGASDDYGWGLTEDGAAVVVWRGADFDVLDGFETLRFSDREVDIAALAGDVIDPTGPNTIADDPNRTQNLVGGTGTDTFTIAGSFADYGWGPTQDGTGVVIWSGDRFDILQGFETIAFADGTLDLETMTLTPDGVNEVADIAGEVQHLAGTAGEDVFVVDGLSTDYAWGATEDGLGHVVWSGANFDVLTDFEAVRFNDATVELV